MRSLTNNRSRTAETVSLAAVLLAMALSSSALIQAQTGAQGPCTSSTRIRLATMVPSGTSYYHSLQEMGAKWKQASNCGIELTIYADSTMGSEDDIVRRMRVGQLQAAVLTVAGLSEIDASVGALQKMPLVYRSLEEAAYVRGKLAPDLNRRLAEKGFVVLFWTDGGWVRFFSREPALLPQDFKKMKIFVTAGDVTLSELYKSAGFNPVLLEWSDVLTSLQTGMVDALPTIPLHALTNQFYLSTHHMLEVNWIPLVGAMIMTKKSWDALPPAQREAMLKAAADCGQEFQTHNRQENQEAVEAMQKRGLQVHPVSKEGEQEWRRFSEGLYPEIRGHIVPADTFDEVVKLLREYRATPGVPGK
jgi:TRAP-type C4-dicarboxylate transport system substrate-binding protein